LTAPSTAQKNPHVADKPGSVHRTARTQRARPRRWSSALALSVAIAVGITACTNGGQDATISTGASAPTQRPVAPSPGAAETDGTSGDTGAAAPGTLASSADPANIPGEEALAEAGTGLPSDPAEAASALVDRMFGDDPARAVAATGELLRRAGLPLGSGMGPMVAMPDDLVITNAQIGVALLPAMTEQVLGGTAFDLDQVHTLLAHLGVSDAFTDAQLIGMIAEWGKGEKDPAESRSAGAAMRALAAKHRQLFAAVDVPDEATLAALKDKPESLPLDAYQRLIDYPTHITLDPVQVLLLVTHVAGAVTDDPVVVQLPPTAERTSATAGAAETPHPFRREASGPCSVVQSPLDTEEGKIAKGLAKKYLQDSLTEAVKQRFGEKSSILLKKGFAGYDQLTDVLSYLAFTLALELDVKPVKKTTTHFLHDEPAHENDVFFRAHAEVRPLVPAEYVDCFAIAGIDIPSAKELKDMQVIWSLPNGRVGLKPAVVGGRQFDAPILLDKHGESTVQTTPRRESHPPADGDDRPQSTVIQTVKAELDKNYLELHVSDIVLMLFGTPAEAAVSLAFKVVVAMIKEAGLPAETIEFPVTYHGSNVYHIFGDANLSIPMYADVPLKADLYSCDGAKGPWQGTVTVAGSAGPVLQAAGQMFGADASGSGEEVVTANFMLNPRTAQLQTFKFGSKYGLVVQLDEAAVDGGLQTRSGTGKIAERMQRIGWASWTIGGQDVRVLAGLIGGFLSQSLDLPVEAVPGDLRCSGAAVYQNEFD
jgi:hypothetical protein